MSKATVLRYRDYLLLTKKLAPKSINLHLTVLRRLAQEGIAEQVLEPSTALAILRIPRVPNRGVRAGVWLPREQAQRILSGPNDAAITAAIIGLAQNLKLSVVAEGVETTEQADFLLQRGCITMQGFLFARPMPKSDFERFMMTSLAASELHKGVFMVDH